MLLGLGANLGVGVVVVEQGGGAGSGEPVFRSNASGGPSPAQPWTYAPTPEQAIGDPIRCYQLGSHGTLYKM
jgi:hypothetical protein